MKISEVLFSILTEHKFLYTAGFAVTALGLILYPIFPYLRFMFFFMIFCGLCCICYGLLLHFEKSNNKAVSLSAKICRIFAVFLICIFAVSFITVQSLIISSMKDDDVTCDYLIVLGSGLNGEEPSLSLKYRLDKAAHYLINHPESIAVLCGGQGPGELITEAEAMQKYLAEKGIDKSRLIQENTSHDTRENIKNAAEIIYSSALLDTSAPIAVVTNDFHLYRAKMIMKKQGFSSVYTLCAKTPPIPALIVNLHLREYFSVMLEYMNL